jgi:hypothetical protein
MRSTRPGLTKLWPIPFSRVSREGPGTKVKSAGTALDEENRQLEDVVRHRGKQVLMP